MKPNFKTYKERIKSVPNPSAQINHLCALDSGNSIQSNRPTNTENTNINRFSYIDAIISVQRDYGVRISEVLAIKGTDITQTGHIHIKGLKRSENRVIKPTEFIDWWLLQRSNTGLIFDGISRYAIYRQYKKRGIYVKIKGRTNMAVTHAFRHKIINELRKSNIHDKDISNFTGHKAEKNTALYGAIEH